MTTSSPKDWLSARKQAKPVTKPVLTMEQLSPALRAVVEKTGATLERLQEVAQRDYAIHLVESLSLRTDIALQELIETDVLAVGELGDPFPKAFTKRVGDGYAIVFHSGFRELIYRAARIVATRTRSIASKAPPLSVEFEEACRILAEVFWWFQETSRSFGPQHDIDEEQLAFAHTIATEAEIFVIAHELGHVFADPSTFANVGASVSESIQLQQDEFDADRVALGLVLGRFRSTPEQLVLEPKHIRAYAGAEFFMQLLLGLEAVGVEPAPTHPRAALRLARLRETAQAWCADAAIYQQLRIMADRIDVLFSAMLRYVTDPQASSAFVRRAAGELVDELRLLLDRCVGTEVPDYWTFQSEWPRIFDKGYSLDLLQEAANATEKFVSELKKYNEDPATDPDGKGMKPSFHKFKLLRSIVLDLPEPAQGLFKAALHLPKKQ